MNKNQKKRTTSPKTKTAGAIKPKRATRRIVNTKRHTTGYVVGGEQLSVAQARTMARRGQIANVRVVGKHIQAVPGKQRLTDLPVVLK